GRVSERRLPLLAIASPFLFTFIMVGVLVLAHLRTHGNLGRITESEELAGISLFSFGLSLVYAILALCGYRGARRRGSIELSERAPRDVALPARTVVRV